MNINVNGKHGATRKKLTIILILLTLIAVIISPLNTIKAQAATEVWVKVGVKTGSSAVSTYTITSSTGKGFALGTTGGGGFVNALPLQGYKELKISVSGQTISLYADNVLISNGLADNNCIYPYDYHYGGILRIDGTAYRGGLCFKILSNGKCSVINYLDSEQYLYGVLHSEMGKSNPKEALKAQAITARSFVINAMGKHSSEGYDVCTTTHCQVYKGYANEYPETIAAVDETKGLKIYYEGKVVGGYYSKNSGGHTQNAEDVWNSHIGYLIGVEDEFSPEYPWTYNLSFADLKKALESAGHDPGTIEKVAITKRNVNGNVSLLEITGSKNTVTLKNENIRTVLGYTSVKSLNFTLTQDGSGIPQPDSGGIKISGSTSTGTMGDQISVLSAAGTVTTINRNALYLQSENSLIKALSLFPGGEGETNETVTDGTLNFSGMGYGHGVGMPQDSAIEMAKNGYTCMDILNKYYTNITVAD